MNLRPHVPKRTPRSISRFKNVESPLDKSPSVEPCQTPTKRKRDFELLTSPESQPVKKLKAESPIKVEEDDMTIKTQLVSMEVPTSFGDEARLSPLPPSSSGRSSSTSSRSSPSEGATSTDATSVDEETIIVEMKSTTTMVSKMTRGKGSKQATLLRPSKANHPVLSTNSDAADTSGHKIQNSDTPVAGLRSNKNLEDSLVAIAARKATKRKRKLPHPTTDLDHAPAIRIPGDYVLTPALLGEPESAWINCRHCEEPFVQKDAYYTRSSCPRCERHSKLYGYMWPKTDKGGIFDTEERILDHRTVHRFIRPSEERTVRRRDRSSTDSRAVTREISEAVAENSDAPKRRGGRRHTTQG